jgi:ABC-type amino acid transport substrate-binding protein
MNCIKFARLVDLFVNGLNRKSNDRVSAMLASSFARLIRATGYSTTLYDSSDLLEFRKLTEIRYLTRIGDMISQLFRCLIIRVSSVICVLLLPCVVLAQNGADITPAERSWILANPNLTVGNELDWAPFDYTDGDVPLGFSIDFIKLVAEKVGLNVKFVNGYTWATLLEMLKSRQLDILPAIYKTQSRMAFVAYTAAYYSEPSIILVHKNNRNINRFADLSGKVVASIKGAAITDALQEKPNGIKLLLVHSVIEGTRAITRKKADAFLNSNGTLSYVLTTFSTFPPIRVIRDDAMRRFENPALHIGVHREQTRLRDILDKGIKAVSAREMTDLKKRWLPFLETN